MESRGHIGPSVVIKGEMSAQEDLRIAGRVEGRIDVEGYTLTVEESGHVHADVAAAGIVIAGTVKGSMVAERRIELRGSANVEGDITAPIVRVDEGAVLRGKVDIQGTRQKLAIAS